MYYRKFNHTEKRILIDSLYINQSGGLRLLEYLIHELRARGIKFHLLADQRCMGKLDYVTSIEYITASMKNRVKWYKRNFSNYSVILCFGNIPVPIKVNATVYTYFHNINLLTLAEAYSIPIKFKSLLKRTVFKCLKNNTDYWLVQTTNTANALIKHLGEVRERVRIFPFYELPIELKSLSNCKHGDDYVFVSDYYPRAKGHEELIEAWKVLHHKGIDKTLHLTIPPKAGVFLEKIKEAQQMGVKIMNHGFIPFNEIIELYRESKVLIYPSHNESLGLGIIEAITAGCDVLGSDLPYIHSICYPSGVFNPYSPDSIVNAVISYEKGVKEKSRLKITNNIDELIGLISG